MNKGVMGSIIERVMNSREYVFTQVQKEQYLNYCWSLVYKESKKEKLVKSIVIINTKGWIEHTS